MSDPTYKHVEMTGQTDLEPAVFLVGFMGAGKSSVGCKLALRLGWAFVDVDDRIAASEGRAIADIFRDDGEAAFRKMESQALVEAIAEVRDGNRMVIALGGGAYADSGNAEAVRKTGYPVVFLDAALEELRQRCALQGTKRPLFQDEERFRELYEARRAHYVKADVRIDTTGQSIEAVAEEIVRVLLVRR